MNATHHRLRLVRAGIDTYQQPVVYMHRDVIAVDHVEHRVPARRLQAREPAEGFGDRTTIAHPSRACTRHIAHARSRGHVAPCPDEGSDVPGLTRINTAPPLRPCNAGAKFTPGRLAMNDNNVRHDGPPAPRASGTRAPAGLTSPANSGQARAAAPITAMLCLCLALPVAARADEGPFGIDHLVTYDDSGIWSRNVQKDLSYGVALTVVGGALWVDGDTRLGRTFDQSLDATVFAVGSAEALKYVFARARPHHGGDPNDFFQGRGHGSFPSGEVAELSAAVTPFIAEYGHDHPAVWALALLPAYDAVARVKVHDHWQSDVLAGAALGVAYGVYAHRRKSPWIASWLPGNGFMFTYVRQF
jgi:undecaprenyl-diphosphatase